MATTLVAVAQKKKKGCQSYQLPSSQSISKGIAKKGLLGILANVTPILGLQWACYCACYFTIRFFHWLQLKSPRDSANKYIYSFLPNHLQFSTSLSINAFSRYGTPSLLPSLSLSLPVCVCLLNLFFFEEKLYNQWSWRANPMGGTVP